MDRVYTERAGPAPASSPEERRGVGIVRPIEAAKEAIPVIDLADRLCGPGQMRRMGERWVARCPLPDHEDKTPSFTVYPGGWWCYGCNRGGDVVDLARLAWDHPDDGRGAAEAASNLLLEFGHELPPRPPAWFRKQKRQAQARDAVAGTRRNLYTRRLFKYLILPDLQHIEDDEEYRRELDRTWAEFRELLS